MKFTIATLATVLLSMTLASPIAVADKSPNFQNLDKRIPASVYGRGQFELTARATPIQVLDNGVLDYYQQDGNFVVYANGVVKWDTGVSLTNACYNNNNCVLAFQSDGNLVTYVNGIPTWDSGTGGGAGQWVVFFDIEPYIVIYNADYYPVWHTPITPPASAPPPAQQGHGGCAEYSGDECTQGPDGMDADPIFEYDF